jgi:hypothetical protein
MQPSPAITPGFFIDQPRRPTMANATDFDFHTALLCRQVLALVSLAAEGANVSGKPGQYVNMLRDVASECTDVADMNERMAPADAE